MEKVEDFIVLQLKKEGKRLMDVNERLRSTIERNKRKLNAIPHN